MQESDLSFEWQDSLRYVDYAFQPVVNPVSGSTFGVEALIRGTENIPFLAGESNSIDAYFDRAYQEGVLFSLDVALRHKVFQKFTTFPTYGNLKLFYNYDQRMMKMANYQPFLMEKLLGHYGLSSSQVCVELSEKHRVNYNNGLKLTVAVGSQKSRGFLVAIDDFGVGYSSFELLYHSDPDIIKLIAFW
ncbi:EAL domain-containing protein (putative c-di-GMP-specific phosphodiesterase class I) [Desulfurispira natronophila]|uniref:EAL domain-containing protein (Putative c-di-GMP-specific phosphodiesterase class I) n=1 Tax=Desulfurispira natronophila TaxID=682562 RepID=A0A7W7Y506_9BACT|nr:EAL domain-containing protein (putative c-di-GMP-specific phosphodiesterase class I) [Desulfurispira natronophila]